MAVELFENKFLASALILGLLFFYLLLRWLGGNRISQHENDVETVLHSDRYKVKGRFE